MANINFNTSNETFRQLFGNGISFKVPSFQRDYSWTQDNWNELWQDIFDMYANDAENGHYMGYLVLQTKNSKEFIIIDGQQRLTTFSIIILAALSIFNDMKNKEIDSANNMLREEQLRRSYIGYIDPVTLVTQSKLTLNRHNDRYFQHYIIPLQELPKRNLNSSERLLYKAFNWFKDELVNRFGERQNSGQQLVEFIDSLVDRIFFTVIRVDDELNAFKVFETLNARGVRLSSTDLLKNYFFSIVERDRVHENEIKLLEEKWSKILEYLADTHDDFPEFLRIFWNSKNKLVRKNELFKTIRKDIKNRENVFRILRDLEQNAEIYSGFKETSDLTLWNDKERANLDLLKMFGIRQPFAMLLTCYKRFYNTDRTIFSQVLEDVVIFSFRYNVICNKQANDQEILYNNISLDIAAGSCSTSSEIRKALSRLYPDNNTFKQDFKNKSFNTTSGRNNKIVKYILSKIERQESGTSDEDQNTINIEHVLPINPGSGWNDLSEHDQEDLVYRIGNLALLEKSLNSEAGNNSFDVKKSIFLRSGFKTTREIAEHHDKWDRESINSRQGKLANIACSIWRFN